MYLWPLPGNMDLLPDGVGVMTRASDGKVPDGIVAGRWWACDNEAFSRGFDVDRMFKHLAKLAPYRNRCLFVVAPDVVGNAVATVELFHEWGQRMRQWGPVAFVAQDGQESLEFPISFDWLFLGGTTGWKMSDAADACIFRARDMGKRIHIGRVNSWKRWKHFAVMGANSGGLS